MSALMTGLYSCWGINSSIGTYEQAVLTLKDWEHSSSDEQAVPAGVWGGVGGGADSTCRP